MHKLAQEMGHFSEINCMVEHLKPVLDATWTINYTNR